MLGRDPYDPRSVARIPRDERVHGLGGVRPDPIERTRTVSTVPCARAASWSSRATK
jgi:hypothetical protein